MTNNQDGLCDGVSSFHFTYLTNELLSSDEDKFPIFDRDRIYRKYCGTVLFCTKLERYLEQLKQEYNEGMLSYEIKKLM